jgi:hypothetical protein
MTDLVRLEGTIGEHKAIKILKFFGYRVSDSDMFAWDNNDNLTFVSCKTKKSRFLKEYGHIDMDFDEGSGLPYYQAFNAKLAFKKYNVSN